jgi:hypothetical protein
VIRFSWRVSFAGVAYGEPGLALIDLTVVEQRYRAMLAVQAGAAVTEVSRAEFDGDHQAWEDEEHGCTEKVPG